MLDPIGADRQLHAILPCFGEIPESINDYREYDCEGHRKHSRWIDTIGAFFCSEDSVSDASLEGSTASSISRFRTYIPWPIWTLSLSSRRLAALRLLGYRVPLDSNSMAHLLLLHGPNLNLLGTREPEIYGRITLPQIDAALAERAATAGHGLSSLQSNAEHVLIERIHATREDGTAFILINPGAFTHTSVALRDALLAVALPFVEIHLSNPHTREPFRHHSYLADKALGVVCGFGVDSYRIALEGVIARLGSDV
ncbi:3-dehydroquinate dehydratase [Xylella fastidiosa]|nr:3-dehydroquinate dehydratase [Xylella fastidiosa]